MPKDFAVAAAKTKLEELLKGVQGVSGIGYGNSHIIVRVDTQEAAAKVPNVIDGVRVEVRVGKIFAFGNGPLTGRVRPAPGGYSIAPINTSWAGTLGSLAIDQTTMALLGLTNAHVLGTPIPGQVRPKPKGTKVTQPAMMDGGSASDVIGEIDRWVPVDVNKTNMVDCAAFAVNPLDSLADVLYDIGKPMTSKLPEVNLNVVKSGRTTGTTYGKVTAVQMSESVIYFGNQPAHFVDCIEVQSPSGLFGDAGDSGSLIVDAETHEPVGLLFAGDTESRTTVGCLTTHVERLLNIKFLDVEIAAGSFLAGFLPAFALSLALGAVVSRRK